MTTPMDMVPRPSWAMTRQDVSSGNLDEIRAVLTESYAPNELSLVGPGKRLSFRLRTLSTPSLAIGHVAFGANIHLEAPPPRTCYVILIPTSGRVEITSPVDSLQVFPGRAAILAPHQHLTYDGWTDDCALTTLRIERAALASLRRRIGLRGEALDLTSFVGLDLLAPSAETLNWSAGLLSKEVLRPGLAVPDVEVTRRLAELVMIGVVRAADPLSVPEHGTRGGAALPPAVRRAIELIDADPFSAGTVVELARRAHVSPRTLQDGFRRYIGLSPMSFARRARLGRAHEELVVSSRFSTTAAAVAHRWGFSNYGRFVALYCERYARTPHETLCES